MQPLNESNNTVINEETGETITDKALSAYAADGESNLVVETLRQKLITDVEEGEAVWDGENFVVLTDTTARSLLLRTTSATVPRKRSIWLPVRRSPSP